jgi:hypothetical protein
MATTAEMIASPEARELGLMKVVEPGLFSAAELPFSLN